MSDDNEVLDSEALKALMEKIKDDPKILELLLGAAGPPMYEGFEIIGGGDGPVAEVRDLLEGDIINRFRDSMLNSGGLPPIAMVFGRNAPSKPWLKSPEGHVKQLILLCNQGFSPEVKERLSRALRKLAWQSNAAAVLFASEAWLLTTDSDEEARKYTGRLSEHPDHVEIIMASIEYDWGECAWYTAEVARDENGKVVDVSPWKVERSNMLRQGRFANFIVKNQVHAA